MASADPGRYRSLRIHQDRRIKDSGDRAVFRLLLVSFFLHFLCSLCFKDFSVFRFGFFGNFGISGNCPSSSFVPFVIGFCFSPCLRASVVGFVFALYLSPPPRRTLSHPLSSRTPAHPPN